MHAKSERLCLVVSKSKDVDGFPDWGFCDGGKSGEEDLGSAAKL